MALLSKKSVDSVLSAFDKARTDLVNLAADLSAQSKIKREKAEAILADAEADAAESARAHRIAERAREMMA